MKEDWIECKISDVYNFIGGGTPSKNHKEFWNGDIPWASIKDIKGKYLEATIDTITQAGLENSASNLADYGDVILATRINPGRGIICKVTTSINQDLKVVKPKLTISSLYTYYLFRTLEREIIRQSSGTTVLGINLTILNDINIVLPPLPIQRAIVKKIEQLFSALDAGIADLKKAQEQLKLYRQAVLKKAFEGIKESKLVSEFAKVETGATPKRGHSSYWSKGNIPWITSGSLNSEFVIKCEEYITEMAIKETNCKIIPRGALLIAMYGEGKTRGKCSELKIDAATNQAISSIIINPEYTNYKKFIKFFFIKNYNDIRLFSNGGVQPNLNLSIIKNTVVPFPKTDKEQLQIVKEIESRLSVCDSLEQQINASLQQTEALRQSILKKAFAGELLTQAEVTACKQEPDYEPASVLLERVKAEKVKVKNKDKWIPAKQEVKPVVVSLPKISADIHAGLIAKIIKLHNAHPSCKDKLSHVKCEKIAHLVEYHAQVPLGRQPVKDAAGPDDYPHLKKVESRAIKAGFFKIKRNNIGYTYLSGKNINKVIEKFDAPLSIDLRNKVDALLQLFLHFDLEQAEIAATVYAGWNNLIILGNSNPSDEEIVNESRENWSARKLSIPRERFFRAINWLRRKEVNLIPRGHGLLVSAPVKKKK